MSLRDREVGPEFLHESCPAKFVDRQQSTKNKSGVHTRSHSYLEVWCVPRRRSTALRVTHKPAVGIHHIDGLLLEVAIESEQPLPRSISQHVPLVRHRVFLGNRSICLTGRPANLWKTSTFLVERRSADPRKRSLVERMEEDTATRAELVNDDSAQRLTL